MPVINDGEKEWLLKCLEGLRNGVAGLERRVSTELGGARPDEVVAMLGTIDLCKSALESKPPGPSEVGSQHAPMLRRAVIHHRREVAELRDVNRTKTLDPKLLAQLDARVAPIDELLAKDGLNDVDPCRMPYLINFLNIGTVEKIQGSMDLAKRIFDEKFHILQSPELFPLDLAHFRKVCDMRSDPLAVAFLDIDDFKAFNTEYTEVMVDRNLLGRFMTELEAHVFNHGYAYRYGGDEYVLLLPNFGSAEAVTLLKAFQNRLRDLSYAGIQRNPTVSVGLCVIDQDCFLTDSEVLERANKGKEKAKKSGKNQIAESRGPRYAIEEINLVP